MERHNRLDEAIKDKIGGLEGEPSARVWANVRTEIGVVRPPAAAAWPMRIAAAVALLCTAGAAWYYLGAQDPATVHGLAMHRESGIKRIVVKPLDREGKEGTFLAHENVHPQQPAPRQAILAPSMAASPKAQQRDSLKNAPLPSPFLKDAPVEIVHAPVPAPSAIPAPSAPDQKLPLPESQPQEVRTEIASAAPSKRSYKVPGKEDLRSENLKRKSGAILGAITNGANTFLGINASYDEKQQDDLKLTAFNADLGLFKIKKVKTVKN